MGESEQYQPPTIDKAAEDTIKKDKEKASRLLNSVQEQLPLGNDQELSESDKYYIMSHNEAFTKLLNSYTDNLEGSLAQKRVFKSAFFLGVCGVLWKILDLTTMVVTQGVNGNLSGENMGLYLTAMGTFLTSFIVLPKVITKYLFNPEEEKGMADIVKAIQEYDTKIRDNRKR